MQFDKVSVSRIFGLFLCGQRTEGDLLDSLMTFDSGLNPHINTYRAASNALADAIRARGIQEVGDTTFEVVKTKEEFKNWTKCVSNRTVPGLVDYVASTDKALLPFLNDHIRSLDGICAYVKSRFG